LWNFAIALLLRASHVLNQNILNHNLFDSDLIRGSVEGLPLQFILYSRSNCPLCEAMEDELRPFIDKYSITVNRLYIDNEAALQALYGDKVPVLTLNNKILCHYFLDTDILLKAIADKN